MEKKNNLDPQYNKLLEDILEKVPSENTLSAGWESTLDPFGFTQIMAQTSLYPGQFRGVANKAYGLKRRKTTVTTEKLQALRASHIFNSIQQSAFMALQMWAPLLLDNFSQAELKRAYRIAVLKTHPDHGGSSESFQEVKNNYQILEALVKNVA